MSDEDLELRIIMLPSIMIGEDNSKTLPLVEQIHVTDFDHGVRMMYNTREYSLLYNIVYIFIFTEKLGSLPMFNQSSYE